MAELPGLRFPVELWQRAFSLLVLVEANGWEQLWLDEKSQTFVQNSDSIYGFLTEDSQFQRSVTLELQQNGREQTGHIYL